MTLFRQVRVGWPPLDEKWFYLYMVFVLLALLCTVQFAVISPHNIRLHSFWFLPFPSIHCLLNFVKYSTPRLEYKKFPCNFPTI